MTSTVLSLSLSSTLHSTVFLPIQEASFFCNGVNIPFEVKVLGPLQYLVQDRAKGQNQYRKSQPHDSKGGSCPFSSPFKNAVSNTWQFPEVSFISPRFPVHVSLRGLHWSLSLTPERAGPCTITWAIHSSLGYLHVYKWLCLRQTALNIQKHSVEKEDQRHYRGSIYLCWVHQAIWICKNTMSKQYNINVTCHKGIFCEKEMLPFKTTENPSLLQIVHTYYILRVSQLNQIRGEAKRLAWRSLISVCTAWRNEGRGL